MEKMITIFAEVAVATIVLFGLVALATALMAQDGSGEIYNGLNTVVKSIFDAATDAAGVAIPE